MKNPEAAELYQKLLEDKKNKQSQEEEKIEIPQENGLDP